MLIHTMDAMPSATTAFSQSAAITTADARDFGRSAASGATVSTDWRVAEVPGAEGLCFVRRGSGDWKGVITVCEGRVATLGSLQKPTLTPAMLKTTASASASTTSASIDSGVLWQRFAAGFLMLLGLGLAAKSGAMMMEGARKYG